MTASSSLELSTAPLARAWPASARITKVGTTGGGWPELSVALDTSTEMVSGSTMSYDKKEDTEREPRGR